MSHPALTQLRALRYFTEIPALEPQLLDWLLLEDSMTKRFEQQGKTAADYSFSSSASWVGVDATGKVTFKNDGDSNTVIITAPPRSGGAIYQTVPPESRSV